MALAKKSTLYIFFWYLCTLATDHVPVKIISQVVRARPQQITWFVVDFLFRLSLPAQPQPQPQHQQHQQHQPQQPQQQYQHRWVDKYTTSWRSTEPKTRQTTCILLTPYFRSRWRVNENTTSWRGHGKSTWIRQVNGTRQFNNNIDENMVSSSGGFFLSNFFILYLIFVLATTITSTMIDDQTQQPTPNPLNVLKQWWQQQ